MATPGGFLWQPLPQHCGAPEQEPRRKVPRGGALPQVLPAACHSRTQRSVPDIFLLSTQESRLPTCWHTVDLHVLGTQ